MSARSTARHRSDSSASTPLTVLVGSVTGTLQSAIASGGRNGAVLAVTTGLAMSVPASSAAVSAPDKGATGSVALAQSAPGDLMTRQVSAVRTADVRFERPAFVVTAADRSRSTTTDDETVDAAAGVARISRSLARAAYKEQQAASTPKARTGSGRTSSGASGVSGASCSISSDIESHLTSNARSVYRAVCAAFGRSVSSFGGYRSGDGGDHGSGRAVDIMVSGAVGWEIARYLQAHARELGVTYVIYEQRIWMAGNPTSQWRFMEDRGSSTANHYDHVHVSVS